MFAEPVEQSCGAVGKPVDVGAPADEEHVDATQVSWGALATDELEPLDEERPVLDLELVE